LRRYITIFVLLIINFLLQTTVFRYIEIAHMVPNLILVVTVAAGLLYGRKCGIFAGVISGLLTDALYGSVIGIGILIYSVVGYLCGAASKLYFEEDLTVPIVAIAGSDVIYGVLYYACNYATRQIKHTFLCEKCDIAGDDLYGHFRCGAIPHYS